MERRLEDDDLLFIIFHTSKALVWNYFNLKLENVKDLECFDGIVFKFNILKETNMKQLLEQIDDHTSSKLIFDHSETENFLQKLISQHNHGTQRQEEKVLSEFIEGIIDSVSSFWLNLNQSSEQDILKTRFRKVFSSNRCKETINQSARKLHSILIQKPRNVLFKQHRYVEIEGTQIFSNFRSPISVNSHQAKGERKIKRKDIQKTVRLKKDSSVHHT
jgi:hypothetical protein